MVKSDNKVHFLFIKISLKSVTYSTKLSGITILNIVKNSNTTKKKNFLEHQKSILDWFPKYHVTLKAEVMAENSALLSQE